jgi:hypothetical protein
MLKRYCILLCSGLVAACGEPAQEPAAPPAAAAESPPEAAAPAPPAALPRQPAPTGARAYIISPADGAVVTNPVRVVFGLAGVGVVPAGIQREDAGHHHLLIDAELPNLGMPIPSDAAHVHFGGGQTETELTLTPGTHTLQLLLGDHLHIPHDPPIASEVVTIEVQ